MSVVSHIIIIKNFVVVSSVGIKRVYCILTDYTFSVVFIRAVSELFP